MSLGGRAMDVELIQVPYDSGHCEARMGRGPGHLLDAGAAGVVGGAAAGGVHVTRLDTELAFPAEIGVAFDLARKLSGDVARARRAGAFPLVLAGNCITALGTLAGLADVPRPGIVWLDAHGDVNTPETSPTGFLDGMGLAICTGRCWRTLASGVPGFAAVPDSAVLHAGARALDPAEAKVLRDGAMLSVSGAEFRADGPAALAPALEMLAARVDAVYLHLDMDVHDADILRANPYAEAGGPTPAQVRDAVDAIAKRMPVAAAALTAYAPECDSDGAVETAALDLLATVAGAVAAR